ncbi:MAG TPA: rod shape-determining protein MreD [Candidatus Alistipes excrementipullorum]|nr:rod shape-determining protein MreD [Candidatus Alistipes excrementipullorum]
MYRTGEYILLFAASVLLQIFFFDELSLSACFAPLVYSVFIILLPLNTPSIAVLAAGLVTGVVMDFAMGTAGLNTIATLAVAYLRMPLLNIIFGHNNVREGGVPSAARMGRRHFGYYLVAMTLLHNALFFGFEAFTTSYLWHQLLRFAVSAAASLLFVWAIARLFTSKLSAR